VFRKLCNISYSVQLTFDYESNDTTSSSVATRGVAKRKGEVVASLSAPAFDKNTTTEEDIPSKKMRVVSHLGHDDTQMMTAIINSESVTTDKGDGRTRCRCGSSCCRGWLPSSQV
jgi:Icc-related predicted phosphoesterase